MKIGTKLTIVSSLVLAAGCAHHARYANEQTSPSYGSSALLDNRDTYNSRYTYSSRGTTVNPSYNSSSVNQNYTPSPAQSITTATPAASDQTLVLQVRQVLSNNPNFTEIVPNVQVTADHGTVILNGTVPNEQQKQAVETLVKGTSGVVNVNNQLQVALSPTASTPSTPSSRIYSNASSTLPQTSSGASSDVSGATASETSSVTATNSSGASSRGLPPTSDRSDQEPRLYPTNNTGVPTSPQSGTWSDKGNATASISAQQTGGDSKGAAGSSITSTAPDQSSTASTNNLSATETKGLSATANSGQVSSIYSNGPSASVSNTTTQPSLYTSAGSPQTNQNSGSTVAQSGVENKQLSATGNPENRKYANQTNTSLTSAESFEVNVRGATQADQAVGQKVITELRSDTSIAALLPTVKINIDNGKATLQGTVKTQEEKLKIETAVQKVTGITSVDDQLKIGAAPGATSRAP